jgi:hypothetical protein
MYVSGQFSALAILLLGKQIPTTHQTVGWVGFTSSLEVMGSKKVHVLQGIEPQTPNP